MRVSGQVAMKISDLFLAAILVSAVSACGTYVPGITEFNSQPGAEQKLVGDIVESIHCEMRQAVHFVLQDKKSVTYPKWFEKWGVQVALTLTIVEKTDINANATGMPPSPAAALVTLAGSGSVSSEATRVSKLSFYYTVKDLARLGQCARRSDERSFEAPLIQSDLGLRDWLNDQVTITVVGPVVHPTSPKGPFGQDVISHDVRFQVISTGSLAPSLKLARVVFNDANSLLTVSRDRTHDLLMTFGPIDPSQPYTLARVAADQHLASQIGLAVANYSRSASFR